MAKRTKAQWIADNLSQRKADPGSAIEWLATQPSTSSTELALIVELLDRGMLTLK